ncbi:MAG: hypothetical protein VSS52_002660 [Thiotrichaceae bacterium]|nr:hypothetical protein [Thiotrichaceae bacterium]
MSEMLSCAELGLESLQDLLSHYGLSVIWVAAGQQIEASFWGDSEAGLVENRLYVRADTPVHSALHEACHYICMDTERRNALHTDAGGDYDEENGVCYLQILLSEQLPNVTKQKAWADMDAWGYSFRLGSTQKWFEQDAEDARQWLLKYQLIDMQNQPRWKLRQT